MSAEVRGGKSLSSEQNIPANSASNLETPPSSGRIRLSQRAEGIMDELKKSSVEKAGEPGFFTKLGEKVKGKTQKGKFFRRVAAGGIGLTMAGAAAPHIDYDQAARDEFKNKTPIEQVVDAVEDKVQIEEAKADAPGDQTFYDVGPDHKNFEAIEYIAEKGIINGFSDGSFGPEKPIARQQFAKMIIGALGLTPKNEAETVPFTDVEDSKASPYPDDFVGAAARLGITYGKTPTKFDPYANITIAQACSMVKRGYENQKPDVLKTPPSSYSGTWDNYDTHGENIRFLQYNGILNNVTIATPGESASRADIAQMLANALKKEQPPVVKRELKKLNITLEELKGYGLPDFEVITGPVSQATQDKFKSFRPNMNVSYEEPTNDPNDMNAVLVKEEILDGVTSMSIQGDGVFKLKKSGAVVFYTGRVVGFAEVNGESYIIAEKRNTHERWALGINTEKGIYSTLFLTADLRKENTSNKYMFDISEEKDQSVYEIVKKFYSTGDTIHATNVVSTTTEDVFDQNGNRQARVLKNFRQDTFDSFAASFYK